MNQQTTPNQSQSNVRDLVNETREFFTSRIGSQVGALDQQQQQNYWSQIVEYCQSQQRQGNQSGQQRTASGAGIGGT